MSTAHLSRRFEADLVCELSPFRVEKFDALQHLDLTSHLYRKRIANCETTKRLVFSWLSFLTAYRKSHHFFCHQCVCKCGLLFSAKLTQEFCFALHPGTNRIMSSIMTESARKLLHYIFLVNVFKVLLELLNGPFRNRRPLDGSDRVNYERPRYILGSRLFAKFKDMLK